VELYPHFIATLILALLVIGVRFLVLWRIGKFEFPSTEAKRKWIVQARNFSLILFVIGLVIVWAPLMKTVALSLAAVAVALVIATKEMLLCLLGGLLKFSARSFHIGDRIEVQHYRGDVVDQGLLTTTLFEIGPEKAAHQYTGRILVIPNSLFLAHPVTNEAFSARYALHVFRVPLRADEDWKAAEETLLKAADEETKYFIEDAKTYFTVQGRREGLDPPSVKPRVNIHLPDSDHIELIVRVPTPLNRKGKMEQAIIRKYLESRKVPEIPVAGSISISRPL
jgi:small-conductance mechanosensitive channel